MRAAESLPEVPGPGTDVVAPLQVSSPGSVDLGAVERHLLHQLVVQLSRVYYDQDDALIAGLHTALSSDNWPEWHELDEDDNWSLSRGGADPAAAGKFTWQEGDLA